jgi:hypothetical protein
LRPSLARARHGRPLPELAVAATVGPLADLARGSPLPSSPRLSHAGLAVAATAGSRPRPPCQTIPAAAPTRAPAPAALYLRRRQQAPPLTSPSLPSSPFDPPRDSSLPTPVAAESFASPWRRSRRGISGLFQSVTRGAGFRRRPRLHPRVCPASFFTGVAALRIHDDHVELEQGRVQAGERRQRRALAGNSVASSGKAAGG